MPGRRKKRNRRVDKAIVQRWHAKRKALERYGLFLKTDDMRDIVEIIQNGGRDEKRFILKESCARSHFLVRFRDQWLPVVYDRTRKGIRTVLPPSVRRQYMIQAGLLVP